MPKDDEDKELDHPRKNRFAPTSIPENLKNEHGKPFNTMPYIIKEEANTVVWFL